MDLSQPITYLWIGLVVLGLVMLYRFYIGALKKEKKVAGMGKGIIAIVMVAVALFGFTQLGTFTAWGRAPFALGTQVQVPVRQPTQQPLQVGGVVHVAAEEVTKTMNLFEKYNPGTSVGAPEYIDVYVEEYDENTGTYSAPKDLGRYAAGSSVDFSPNDRVTLVPCVNSSPTGYYGKIETQIVGLSGTETYAGVVADANSASDAGMTISVNNVDGSVNTVTAGRQTIDAGSVKTLKFRIDGAYEDDFSTGKVCFACMYNKTAYDEIILTSDIAGQIYPAISRDCPPDDLSIPSAATIDAFEMNDPITNLKVITGSITLDADDNNNPGNDSAIVLDDKYSVVCSLHDQDVYIDSNDNLPKIGYQDEKGAEVGLHWSSVNLSVAVT